jgi:hypothetical protein
MTGATFVLAVLVAAQGVPADRLTDKDVKELIERVDEERDRFEDQLDGDLKRSILRGPGGEVHVERYLDDLQENVDRLKERFTPQYAASQEATTVLRQASDIHRYMSTQAPNFKGASEWNRLSSSLSQLAAVYGTALPIPAGQLARRINDRELRQAADNVAKNADRFKKELDSALKKDKSIDKATRDAAVSEAEALKQDAKTLSSRIGEGKPASGEARQVVERAAKIGAAAAAKPLSPAAQSAWSAVGSSLDTVAQGFGLPPR